MNPRPEIRNPPARVLGAVREGGLWVSERRFNAVHTTFPYTLLRAVRGAEALNMLRKLLQFGGVQVGDGPEGHAGLRPMQKMVTLARLGLQRDVFLGR